MVLFNPKGSLLSEYRVLSIVDSNSKNTLVPIMSLLATPAEDENCRSTSLESALITASVRSNSLESRPHFHRADLAYCWLTRSVTSSRPTHSLCWSTLHTNCTAAGRIHPYGEWGEVPTYRRWISCNARFLFLWSVMAVFFKFGCCMLQDACCSAAYKM